jgi:dCMP deaminase
VITSWDETWMMVADDVALRGSCSKAQHGAVIVSSENRIVATGYNGPPAGLTADVFDPAHLGSVLSRPVTCERDCERAAKTRVGEPLCPGYTDCLSIHAEANALLFCDRRDRANGTIYVNGASCYSCAKLIANSGLARVVYRVLASESYRAPARSVDLLVNSGLAVFEWSGGPTRDLVHP